MVGRFMSLLHVALFLSLTRHITLAVSAVSTGLLHRLLGRVLKARGAFTELYLSFSDLKPPVQRLLGCYMSLKGGVACTAIVKNETHHLTNCAETYTIFYESTVCKSGVCVPPIAPPVAQFCSEGANRSTGRPMRDGSLEHTHKPRAPGRHPSFPTNDPKPNPGLPRL